jgi:hypothetical protein
LQLAKPEKNSGGVSCTAVVKATGKLKRCNELVNKKWEQLHENYSLFS